MRILHVNNWLPARPIDGGLIRKQWHLRALCREHEVWVSGRVRAREDLDAFRQAFPRVHVVEVPEAEVPGRTQVAAVARELIASGQFDAVHVSGLPQWPGTGACGSAAVVLDVDSLESRILAAKRAIEAGAVSPLDLAAVEAFERTALRRADRVLVCSAVDAAVVRRAAPEAKLRMVENGVDLDMFTWSERRSVPEVPIVTFTGFLAYWPNADACVHLVRDVLPLVRRHISRAVVRLVGRVPPAEVMALGTEPGVEIHPNVADIRPLLAGADLIVVPLRAGSGTRLKILEAFAVGRPVVSTTVGCEGLPVASGTHLLVADGAEALASAIVRVLTDRRLADRLVVNARSLVNTRFDWRRIGETLLDVYRELGETGRRPV